MIYWAEFTVVSIPAGENVNNRPSCVDLSTGTIVRNLSLVSVFTIHTITCQFQCKLNQSFIIMAAENTLKMLAAVMNKEKSLKPYTFLI